MYVCGMFVFEVYVRINTIENIKLEEFCSNISNEQTSIDLKAI